MSCAPRWPRNGARLIAARRARSAALRSRTQSAGRRETAEAALQRSRTLARELDAVMFRARTLLGPGASKRPTRDAVRAGCACMRATEAEASSSGVDEDPGFAPHRAIAAASGFRAVLSTP
jgi:hypothetical protein